MLNQLGEFISMEVAKTLSNKQQEEDVNAMEDKENEDNDEDDSIEEEDVAMDNEE